MSKTVHIKGALKPTNKTVVEYVCDNVGADKMPSYYESVEEFFQEHFYRKAVEINGLVYEVVTKNLDPDDDIFNASTNADKSINVELRYYNGGCSFDEAIKEALKNLDKGK